MVCFVNVQSVDRIIYSIFQKLNLEKTAPSALLHKRLDVPRRTPSLEAQSKADVY
jgi:hypothetical protein